VVQEKSEIMTAPKKNTEDARKSDKKASKAHTASGEKRQKKSKSGKKPDEKETKDTSAAPEAETPPPVDDRYLRLQADFDNYRKRVLRERDELYRRANEDIMEELLPVLDHLELALGSVGEAHKNDPVVEGFRLVGEQLMGTLGKFGLSAIECDGEEFDPNMHEAILHMPSSDVAENLVVSATRRGYKLGERLLRASQVVVSSGPPSDEKEETLGEE
jgi:molecular chaperone GrpE